MSTIGSFGEYVFGMDSNGHGSTFTALRFTRASRMASHATIEGLPVVEFLGLDSSNITLSGRLVAEFSGDLDDKMLELMMLQDGEPRVLTRGTRCYGLFVVKSIEFSEDRWAGAVPVSISWTMQLTSTRD